MIKPTIGRVVWYHPQHKHIQPHAALIAFVHSDTLVNLAVFDENGSHQATIDVPLYQNEPNQERPQYGFCEWMPYQQGQAAKTQELEKKLEQK
jgi:hypothetical protein